MGWHRTGSLTSRHGSDGTLLEATGSLFSGVVQSILVDTDAYLAAVCRYVELNPVRAGMVAAASDWAWSSYSAHVGAATAPAWLDVARLHEFVMAGALTTAADHAAAAAAYAELVAAAPVGSLWDKALQQQIFLGDDAFIARMQALAAAPLLGSQQIPLAQRSMPVTLAEWLERCETREEALMMAHRKSGLSMSAMATEIGLSATRVGQLIRRAEAAKR